MSQQKPEPIFATGLLIKEHTFSNGGSILKVGVNVESFIAFLQANKKPSGWCNLIISKMKRPSEKGTHYATLDRWEPGSKPYAPRSSAPVEPEQRTDDESQEPPF